MPLVYYDIVRGRSRDEVRALLDSAQAALVEAFGTPERDRYQLLTEHSPDEMIIEDNGLGYRALRKHGGHPSDQPAGKENSVSEGEALRVASPET